MNAAFWNNVRNILVRDQRNGLEILQSDIAKNPFYPFQLGLTVDESRVFTLRAPYKERFVGTLVFMGCLLLILLFLVLKMSTTSVVFVYLNFVMVLSIAVMINYRHERIYVLDEDHKMYSFVVGDRNVTEHYHNIYIRLSKQRMPGRPHKENEQSWYHLVLDGVKIDRQVLTKKPISDIKLLRKFGQKLAKNLNINYFDEANVSVFHSVRHWPQIRAIS